MENDLENEKNYKYGLKIYNYEASSIYETDLGIRDDYERTRSIFANSLFCEFLTKNKKFKTCSFKSDLDSGKLIIKNNGSGNSTADIICLKFTSGSKSYEEEIVSLKTKLREATKEKENEINSLKKIVIENNISQKDFDKQKEHIENEYDKKINYFNQRIKSANQNKDKFKKISTDELRKEFYQNGVSIQYGEKKIKYKMLYRTTGKAKEGSCMFIRDGLYDEARKFLRMGKSKFLNEKNHVVEIGAYQSLVASNIVGKVKINPKNILIIKDVDIYFNRKVISFSKLINEHNLTSEPIQTNDDESQMKNTLFDGQALIDTTIFENSIFYFKDDNGEYEKPNGYILLRHHFCKMAAFCTDIKEFFKDYCLEHNKDYDTFSVKDLFGQEHFVKDIELITTENAMKWFKFGDTEEDFKNWCDRVNENDNMFGIVKTAHESKLKQFQRMSYQMVNALDCDENKMKDVAMCSKTYIENLKNASDDFLTDNSKNIGDNDFIKFLECNKTYSNDYEVLVELCKRNRNFLRSEYFRDRRSQIIYDFTKKIKGGKILQNAENLVIVGSPYAMLLSAVGEKPEADDMFEIETGENPAIQCYTERFPDKTQLAEFRSPFNSKNNLGYMRNVYPKEKIKKYFKNFGKQIIAVNMIGTDFQARNNGADQDSDSIYTTDQSTIVDCAKKYYDKYPTIINDIPKESQKKSKDNLSLLEKYAEVDNKLSEAKLEIGKASNLALLCLTYACNSELETQKKAYEDYVCILSVIAQIAIDKAKRNFSFDSNEAISKIRNKMQIEEYKYPCFWKVVDEKNESKKNKGSSAKERNFNSNLKCPMNYIYQMEFSKHKSKYGGLGMENFFVPFESDGKSNKTTKIEKEVESLIENYGLELLNQNTENTSEDERDSYLLSRLNFEDMLNEIKNKKIISRRLFSILIDRAFCITPGQKRNVNTIDSNTKKNKSLLLKTLYLLDKEKLLDCFKKEDD